MIVCVQGAGHSQWREHGETFPEVVLLDGSEKVRGVGLVVPVGLFRVCICLDECLPDVSAAEVVGVSLDGGVIHGEMEGAHEGDFELSAKFFLFLGGACNNP